MRRDRNDNDQSKQEKEDTRPNLYKGTPDERLARIRNFISSMHFSVPLKTLHENSGRTACPKCGKNRRFYCYDCLCGCNEKANPPVAPTLPVEVHVVLHPGENRGKATTLAAASVAPDQIKIHTFPAIPDLKVEETVLLYPSASAVNIGDMTPEDLASVKNIVFIDSTWQQSKKIERDEKIQSFRHVKIPAQETLFWRFQNYDPTYLATVEAIYYTLREIIQAKNKQKIEAGGDNKSEATASPAALYNGEVDDLLLYYVYQYLLIQISFAAGQRAKAAKEKKAAEAAEGGDAPKNDAGKKSDNKNGDDDDDNNEGKNNSNDAEGGEGDHEFSRGFTTRHFKGYILEENDFEKFFQ